MILPLSGSNQIVDVTASEIRVTIKRRKTTSLSSDALLQQSSKLEVWGEVEKLSICGNECAVAKENYIFEETPPLFFRNTACKALK